MLNVEFLLELLKGDKVNLLKMFLKDRIQPVRQITEIRNLLGKSLIEQKERFFRLQIELNQVGYIFSIFV